MTQGPGTAGTAGTAGVGNPSAGRGGVIAWEELTLTLKGLTGVLSLAYVYVLHWKMFKSRDTLEE